MDQINRKTLQYFIDLGAAWRTKMDTPQIPYTPALDVYLAREKNNPDLWWTLQCGHHQNLFEEAVTRMEKAEAALYNLRHALKACTGAFENLSAQLEQLEDK